LVIIISRRARELLLINVLILLKTILIKVPSSNIICIYLSFDLMVVNALSWSCWIAGKIIGRDFTIWAAAWHVRRGWSSLLLLLVGSRLPDCGRSS